MIGGTDSNARPPRTPSLGGGTCPRRPTRGISGAWRSQPRGWPGLPNGLSPHPGVNGELFASPAVRDDLGSSLVRHWHHCVQFGEPLVLLCFRATQISAGVEDREIANAQKSGSENLDHSGTSMPSTASIAAAFWASRTTVLGTVCKPVVRGHAWDEQSAQDAPFVPIRRHSEGLALFSERQLHHPCGDTIRHRHGNDVRQTGQQVVVMVLAEVGYF